MSKLKKTVSGAISVAPAELGRAAQAALDLGLGHGELDPVVDPLRLGLVTGTTATRSPSATARATASGR